MAHREAAWVRRLEEELTSARDLLARFPLAGSPGTGEAGSFRRLVLRRLPFLVWYTVEKRGVLLLRLFHVRQDRPR